MKKLVVFALLLLAFAFSGCAVHYDVSLFSGEMFRVPNKPKLNSAGYYVIKDASGQEVQISKMRVRKIEAVNKGAPPSFSFD